ncbi:hypothetical protein CVT26_013026 [Gymnopilus dilepis]|uniref:Ricin B lectin domain-containing protein n=1 Tax=Gymnopilus dilepis TaxID=231916 RepID=A0A409Y4A9_9AGAR|nr:hypothetical protein CVT26_013026 [Gymnopilus dilepis]
MVFSLTFLGLTWLVTSLAQDVAEYHVINECPAALNLYINGQQDSLIDSGSSDFKILGLSLTSFYTDLNGGNPNGSLSTQAHFNPATNQFMWYYIVKSPDNFNTGVEILTSQTAANGICEPAECVDASCNTAFTPATAPTSFTTPSAPLLNQCAKTIVVYNVTFCPGGFFPGNAPSSTTIHPDFDDSKCLDVQGAVYENGTPVQIFDCNGTGAQQWELTRGSTKVKVAGQNFCLDAGSTPANGVGMKIWECFDNLPAQQWFYTDDNRIALENQGLCLDLNNGVTTNGNKVQTWQCTDFDNFQIWDAAA